MVLIEADIDVNSGDEADSDNQGEGKEGGSHEQSVLFFNDDTRQKRLTGQLCRDQSISLSPSLPSSLSLDKIFSGETMKNGH